MLKKRGVSWGVAVALALVGAVVAIPTTARAATTITVSAAQDVQAQMALHYGSSTSAAAGGTANYETADCLRLGSQTGTATTGSIPNPGGTAITSAATGSTAYLASGGMVWAAHGTSNTNGNCPNRNGPTSGQLSLDAQSSLGFAPASVASFSPGGIFNLGRVAHKNTGIYLDSGNQYFRGNLNLKFMGMTLTYGYEIHETTGSNVADTTTFLNQVGTQTFTHEGISYTLIVRGFTAAGAGNTCSATVASLGSVTTTFTTPEEATTWGCLYAQIQQVRPLTVVKQVAAPHGAPVSYPAFSFTGSSDVAGSPWGGAFTLTPTGPGAAGRASRTADLVTGQTINLAEAVPTAAGWAFTGLSCMDGAGNTTIEGLTTSGAQVSLAGDYGTTSAAAAPITCTYTNTYTPLATLTLVKQVTTTGQSGTPAVPADWTLTATGTGAVSGQSVSGPSGSSAVTARTLIAGSYTLSEAGNSPAATAGYVQTGAWSCSAGTLSGNTLTLAAGQSVTCTVRNTFAVGRLAITKTVTGSGYTGGDTRGFTAAYTCTSGTTTVKAGTVTVRPGATNGTPGTPVVVDAVPAGATCTVTETGAPTGTSDGLQDSSWTWGAPVNPAPVTIGAGATSTVTLTNPTSRQLGSLQLAVAVSPRSGVPGAGYTGGPARTFGVSYSCTLAGTPVSSGTVEVSEAAPVTISGVPASATCAVTGEDQAARSGDFADASYAWDGWSAGDAVTITPNATATISVTNVFRRDLATLRLAKVVTGNGYAGSGADFTLRYDCGAPYTGRVDVAAGGSAIVDVPAGVACTVDEEPPADGLLRPGYVWGDPTWTGLSGGTVSAPAGGTATVTATNPTGIGFGRLQVTKRVDSFASAVASGTVFGVRVRCDAPARGEAGDYAESFELAWPSAVTVLTPWLPAGTRCSVAETDAPDGHEALPDESYAWRASPDPVTVSVPASEDALDVAVTNDVRRVYATFRIAKDVVNHTGHDVGGARFSGSYRCDYNGGEDVRSGGWAVTGQGTAHTVEVLVGSTCTVTEDAPGAPVDGDRSYTWSTQTPSATPVGPDGATATVVNTLNRAEGSFSITKSVAGGLAGEAFPEGAEFSFRWSCTPPTGDVLGGSLAVRSGDSRAPAEPIPGGSTCTVTEGDAPGTLDPYRWDDVRLSVSGEAATTGASGRSITFTTTDDARPVAVRVVNTISPKTASVRVTKQVTGETAGYNGAAVFDVTLTCSTGGQGTRTIAAGESATWDGIPLGATCAATEGSSPGGLQDNSYAWGPAEIGDPVTLSHPDTYAITIRNPISRVYAGIEVAKVVDANGHAGVADPDQQFSGRWSCRYRDDDPVGGTWAGAGSADGTLATLTGDADHVLVGSDCTLTEDTPGAPGADPSYRWAEAGLAGTTVHEGRSNRLVVTNPLRRDTGRVIVTKRLTGATDGYAPAPGFAGFSVFARCWLASPDEDGRLEASVRVQPGDERVLIDQVPYGWTCRVWEGPFPSPDQLRDASFAWDSQAVAFGDGTAEVEVSAADDAPRAVVTNGIRRVTGRLAIRTAYGDGTADAVRAGTTFSGSWRCTYGSEEWTGGWTATGAGPAVLTGPTDLPFTARCTATQDAPSDADLRDSSYTWAEPDLGGSVEVASAAEPAQLVVTNTATRRWGGLEVSTSYAGPSGAFADDLELTGTWSCVYRGAIVGSGGWRLPATGGSAVVARPADAAIPAAASCTVTQDSLPAEALTDGSYAWATPALTPGGGTVTTAAGETATVAIANATTRVRASFEVTKQLVLGNGVLASALESDLVFSGHWRCTHEGDDPVGGDWGPIAADAGWTSPPVLVGSTCQVTAEDEPAAPSRVDDSYLWSTADLGDPITVVAAPQPRAAVVVANPVARVTGSFGVTKVVTGDIEGTTAGAAFTFTWRCTARDGDLFPSAGPGTFSLTAGRTWNAPESVPLGSECEVTEAELPEPSDLSYRWSADFDVRNATGSSSGRTVRFTLPRHGAPVAVTATNTLTRTKGSFTVAKTADPGDGATVVPGQAIHYTVTVTGAPVGFTDDVVVTDALAGVLPHADVTDITASQGGASLDGTDLVWSVGTVRAGAVLQLRYTATVHADAVGADLVNTVAATGEVDPGPCGAACTTTHHTPAWTLAKRSDPASGAVVVPGEVITYTLTATNTGNGVVAGATASDDLSGLADASVGFSSAALSRTGDTLAWAIPTLAPGEQAEVSYTATVRPGADGATLRNTVTPHGAGASCEGACATTQRTVKWELEKSSVPAEGTVVAPGDDLSWTLRVTNTGPVTLTGALVADDIADVVDDATLAPLPAGLARTGDTLSWAMPTLAPGASATVSYAATVDADAVGATLRNTAAPASAGGSCHGSCTTTQTTPAWVLAKTADAPDGATVEPGDQLGYTLTVTNTGPATLSGAVVLDDLTDVLDDATLAAVPSGAILTGSSLRWAVPDLAPGASASLAYRVEVTDDGATLTNTAAPASAGGACTDCSTSHVTPAWVLAKTSDPADGENVAVGDVITWTLTATNTGPGVVAGATAADDLSGVLPNAEVSFTSPQLSRAGSTLTWAIPTLLPGERGSVTYTAVVRQAGVRVTNVVTPVGAGGSCAGCTTSQATPRWGLVKTSDPASGSTVLPGQLLTYTLTATNSGPVPVVGARVVDDLSGLLDEAGLGVLPEGLTLDGDTLTWAVPTIEVGGVVAVSYPVIVGTGSAGATITNAARPVGRGGYCALDCTTTAFTDAWTLAKTSTPGDGATVLPGQAVGWTLGVTNTGPTTLQGAIVVDDLSDVLDDVEIGPLPPGASLSGTTLTWHVPAVAPGEGVTLAYGGTVRADAVGARLRNTAAPASTGGSCAESCTTTQYSPAWTLAKTANPASGVVAPGDLVTWTLTATNTSRATLAGAVARDDLGSVLAAADVVADSPGLDLAGDTLTWAIPTLAPGETRSVSYTARVRAGADGATLANTVRPVGPGGSCTDCATRHTTPAWTLAKTADPASGVVEPGETIRWSLLVTNDGPDPLVGALVRDDLSGLDGDAVLGTLPAGLARDGDTLTWAVPVVAPGATATVTYTATVQPDARGATLANTAAPASPGGRCTACTTTHTTAAWLLEKTSDAAATVHPGDVVGYTLTVTNTGPATLSGALVTDDLADVLDDATLHALPRGATREGSTLTWAVPDLAPGATEELTYAVTVTDDGATLRNTATAASPGGTCGTCTTTAASPAWLLEKRSDAPAVVEPGDVVTWTLVATNTSSAVVAGAQASDDLTDVRDDATLSDLPAGLVLDGSTATWTIPTLAAGESASISYSATVTADGASITNTAVPVGAGGSCGTCTTTTTSPGWTLAKTSDRPHGAVLAPGDVVSYTLVVTNTGAAPLVGAMVSDDVSDLLDDATLGDLPDGFTRDGDTLTWRVPPVPVGGTATTGYTATVTGLGASLVNTAAPATVGGTCLDCTTTAHTPRWELTKTSDAPGVVEPGDVVGYTLSVTNTGPVALTGASVVDDLGDVLDDATLVALPERAVLDGSTLTWAVPEVPAGGTATLAYAVRLSEAARGATLRNVAAPASVGGSCPQACATTSSTTAWTLAKDSDPGDGATVLPGDEISYTLRVDNTGPVVLSGAVVQDDMSGLLDDADLVGDLPAGATRAGTLLTWQVPDVPVGGFVEARYTVRVRAGAYGASLVNRASGRGATSCALGGVRPIVLGADTACVTRHVSPAWSLEKTVDAGDGAVVEPGSELTYTLVVRNTSQAVVRDAVVTDDLAEVLGYASLASLPPGTVLGGTVLTWTVPVLQPGEIASVSYTVSVPDEPEAYNGRFTNTAVASGAGSCLDCTVELATIPAVVDPTHDDDDDDPRRPRPSDAGHLAYTGSDLGVLGLAGVALAAGLGLLVAGRRRRDDDA